MNSGRIVGMALLGAMLGIAATGSTQAAEPPLKVGLLEDVSGDLAFMGMPKLHGSQLAVEEINKSGGILGRQIELIHLDPQGDNARYQEFGRRLLNRDKVDVLIGGITSASREALRPIVDRTTTPYFYTNQYEGGVCDASMVSMGAVPEQQFSTLIPWMVEKFGKKVYVIAADYNFGQISAEWNRKIMKDLGGEVVGEEFIPLGVSQFSQSIQNIQKAKPDFVVTLLVGTAQASYYEQAASANVNLPMASSVNVGQGYEHKRFKPTSLKDMYVTTNYIEEIDTPKSKEFYAKFKAKFPSEPYVNQEAENSYLAVYLYKQMVERAKSTNRDEIRKVIAMGDVCMDAPEGKVCIDPKSQHMSHTIYLAKVGADHSISFPKIWEDIKPYWLGEAGCDLTKKDPMAQYTPSNPPPKP